MAKNSKASQVRELIRANINKSEAELVDMVVSQIGFKKALAKVYVQSNLEKATTEPKVKVEPAKKENGKYPTTITSAQITPENAIGVSEQFGYEIGNRSAEEQAEYVKILLKTKAATRPFPMADLLEKVKQGETRASSMSDHYK